MEKWQWAFTIAAPMLVGLFVKFCPKKKLIAWIEKPCRGLGITISKFLVLRIGKRAANRVEEGIISTILTVLGQIPLFINDGLLSDNNKKRIESNIKRRK